MGVRVPEFWITLDEMRDDGLPETFDYLRFQKGSDNYPFICVHPDEAFINMISLDDVEIPDDVDFASTPTIVSKKMPGIYKMTKSPLNPEFDVNEKDQTPVSNKEAFKKHLENMKNQSLNYELDEKTFRSLLSREHLEKQSSFMYKENLVYSILNEVASLNHNFPEKWNFNNIPGPLKSFCAGNGGANEILGVSSAMLYAGEEKTYCPWHVEDADCASCNLLLPFSAGKVSLIELQFCI
uniref:JmjC domain-containing protein n=1 Tax=Panagrolaimus sp. ES5 TaxID=591445 RepID=A0AC34FG47_9BILA